MEKIHCSRHSLVSVVTGVDKEKGRGRKASANPVKERALELGLETREFEKLDSLFMEWLSGVSFDAAVVVSFGVIIPREVFERFPQKWLNVHPSLLPKYRGPAPMLEALLNGDDRTGVTINEVVYEVDTGKIYARTEFKIEKKDNMADLRDRAISFGGPLLISVLDLIEDRGYAPYPQDGRGISYTRKITGRDLKIDWSCNCEKIFNCIRAFSPHPGAYTFWKDLRLKILEATVKSIAGTGPEHPEGFSGNGGIVIHADRTHGLVVRCGDGKALAIGIVQPPGKKPMPFLDFLNGYRIKAGDFFR